MSKLYLSEDDYKYMSQDSRQVTPAYIAVDAYLTGLFAGDDAVRLGDIWQLLGDFETKFETGESFVLEDDLEPIWDMAWPTERLPNMLWNESGDIDGWDYADDLVEMVLKNLRTYVIDQIYEVQPDE